MENIEEIEISRSLGYQIRKYREADFNKPVLLLTFCDEENGQRNHKENVGQFVAFCVYTDKNLKNLDYIIPADLAISGVMVFQKHQFNKATEIVENLKNSTENIIENFDKRIFYYDEDEDEFFKLLTTEGNKVKKSVEIEVSETDNYLDFFILTGSFKFAKDSNIPLEEKIRDSLKHGGFLRINELLEENILLLPNIDANNFKIKMGKFDPKKENLKNLISFVKDYRKYNIDETSPTPVSHLPKHSCEILMHFQDETTEINFHEIGEKNISYDYVDFMTFVRIEEVRENFENVIRRLLRDINRRIKSQYRMIVNYQNSSSPFYISNILKQTEPENDFSFSDSKVYFKQARIATEQRTTLHPEKLRNVHLGILKKSKIPNIKCVRGDYIYFHYNQDGFIDEGWGCAYRALQSLYSWFLLQGYTSRDVPSIPEMQETLFTIGDKPAKFVGSRDWIGSMEVSYILQKLINVDSRIITITSGAEILSKALEFKSHFETFGTPIMIGGGVLAFTMLGIAVDEDNIEDTQFLILDPHYKGKRNWKTITDSKKGGVYWKTSKMFQAKHFYNFCCPIPSSY